jgi:hypothetical protein
MTAGAIMERASQRPAGLEFWGLGFVFRRDGLRAVRLIFGPVRRKNGTAQRPSLPGTPSPPLIARVYASA